MRPRIFLAGEDQEFFSTLYNDLNDVKQLSLDFPAKRNFLHIGFKPIDAELVSEALSKMPAGLYCSNTFVGSGPGDLWEFSPPLIMLPDNTDVFFVTQAPISNFEIDDVQLERVQSLIETSVTSGSGPEIVTDEYLSEHQWSVRTSNVFARHKIEFLSQLLTYSDKDLLKLPNFGRTSLAEIKKFLTERGLSLNSSVPFSSNISESEGSDLLFKKATAKKYEISTETNFFYDIDQALSAVCDGRQYHIISNRSGLKDTQTLEQLAVEYGITRERIRQIEKKGLLKLFTRKSNAFSAWYSVFSDITDRYLFPVPVDDYSNVDDRFDSDKPIFNLVRYIVYFVNKIDKPEPNQTLFPLWHRGRTYLTRADENTYELLKKKLIEVMQSSENTPLKDIRKKMANYLSPTTEGLVELLISEQIQKSITHQDEYGETVFVRFVKRSKIESGKDFLIEQIELSDCPLSNDELKSLLKASAIDVSYRSVANAMASSEDVFPTRHGRWGTFRHLTFSKEERDLVLQTAEHLSETSPEAQFHSREVRDVISHQINEDLTEFGVTAILNKFGKYSYLGRNVFAPKGSNLEKRVLVNDMMVRVLREFDRPMHASELIEATKKYVSVDDNIMVQPRSPMINVGQNTFALDFWDEDKLGNLSNSNFAKLSVNKRLIINILLESFGEGVGVSRALAYQTVWPALPNTRKSNQTYASRALDELVTDGFIENRDGCLFVKLPD